MKMQVLPLSHVDGYVARPIQKIYSTKSINGSKNLFSRSFDAPTISKAGEIKLTKACDRSLLNQAKKLGGDMVLGAGYSVFMNDDVTGINITTSISVASMYAYGEVVKLIPKSFTTQY